MPKLLRADRQSDNVWGGGDKEYWDCFCDAGASPVDNYTLWDWMDNGHIWDGIPVRKPHIIYDELRDTIYPEFIGQRLGLAEPSVFYSNSGTEAIEAAIKLVRRSTERSVVLGIQGDFHGRTYGALSLSRGNPNASHHTDGFGPFVGDIKAVREESWEYWAESKAIAGVVLSPVNGNNTLLRWPQWVWDFVSAATSNGALLVYDEVQTGFGRAGGSVSITQTEEWQHYPKPDVWVFGKGMAAGWPMSMTITSAAIAEVMGPGSHFNTMAGSPLGCYLSRRWVARLEAGVMSDAVERSGRWASQFDMRRIGAMLAFDHPRKSEFVQTALRHGLILSAADHHDMIRFSPHMLLDEESEYQITERLKLAFQCCPRDLPV